MRITFILPYAGLAGGVRVVAIYAQWLSEQGHQVNVISTSRKPIGIKRALQELWRHKKLTFGCQPQGDSHLTVGTYNWIVLPHNGPVIDSDVPDSDLVIATWWKTADWVHGLCGNKGKKVYFCQHYETHNYFSRDLVEATYFYPMVQICVSDWVRKKIESLTGIDNQRVVMNGVDAEQFNAPDRQKNTHLRLGFVYSPMHWKGVDMIIEALSIVRQRHPEITAVCFGSKSPVNGFPLPSWIDFIENPDQREIPNIYSQCDGWLFASREEGFGLPILEAMACHTPVIATPAGAAPELINDKNGFLVTSYTALDLVEKIHDLVMIRPDHWKSMSQNARTTAVHRDWSIAASSFESILIKVDGEEL